VRTCGAQKGQFAGLRSVDAILTWVVGTASMLQQHKVLPLSRHPQEFLVAVLYVGQHHHLVKK
jgi:hypothetical protein